MTIVAAANMAMNDIADLFGGRAGLIAAAILAAVTASSSAVAQSVVVVVNGQPITTRDIDQRTKLEQLSTRKTPSRQVVLDELIDEILKVREAKRWGIEIPNSEVESAYATMSRRMRVSPEQLTQNLARAGINANTLKARIRADLAWQQLVRGRFQTSLQVGEKDVLAALESKSIDDKTTAAYDYTMRPILFLVPPGAPSSVVQSRRREAEALRTSFKNCEDGIPFARTLRDVAVRDQVIRSSADIPAELRKVLESVPLGQLTEPEITKLGVEMFAVCAKTESKADTPAKRQIRDALFAQRFEQRSKRYLQELRRGAMLDYK